ncbi:merozoite surface antigen-2a1 isoform A [Chlorella sorokiniana]|nr:merozoite surface antigen-2a1 isoform A [Chlorella sorokiniana]|eukprot:PRW57709.1 merozoite surface antigen-2a1 isoform A [Chlorella sorokiniana]
MQLRAALAAAAAGPLLHLPAGTRQPQRCPSAASAAATSAASADTQQPESQQDIGKLAIQAAASPDGPLIWSIKENQLGLLRTLLDAGADPDG